MTHKYTSQVKEIFDYWNAKKVRGNAWKGCSEITPNIAKAITNWLKEGYTVKHLTDALDNYALILLNSDYTWTYAWSIYELFTRGKKWDRTDKQLYRFLANNFQAIDYMTESAKRRLKAVKQPLQKRKPLVLVTEEEKKRIRKKLPWTLQQKLVKHKA